MTESQSGFRVEAEWWIDDQADAETLCESLMLLGAETAGSSPQPTSDSPCSHCADLIANLRARLRRYEQYRTLGGPPHPPGQTWENRWIEPPSTAVRAPWEKG